MAGFKKVGTSPDHPQTAEEQLAKMRAGYEQELKLKLGEFEIPVRLMAAGEEATIIANAKMNVKVPPKEDPRLHTSIAVMKAHLGNAATIDKVPGLAQRTLDSMTFQELNALFDQYISLCEAVNPDIEKLKPEEIAAMIIAVKKKEKEPTAFFTSDLAAIGKYFLEHLLPEASVPGS